MAEPFCFIHCADLHLDSPFKGMRSENPQVADTLRESTFGAFAGVIDLAIDRRVDFLLIAGDVYDSGDHSLRAQIRFRDELRRAASKGIRSFIVHGNHDPLNAWDAKLALPEAAHRFEADSVECVPVERDGQLIADVYGISFPVREVTDNLALRFERTGSAPFAIGLLHANVGGNSDFDNYAPCSIEDLTGRRMDYWALGHVHTRAVLRERDPCILYPGNIQGRSPRETGPRGCYLVDVDAAGRVQYEFHATDTVRWVGPDDVASPAIAESGGAAVEEQDGPAAVIRIEDLQTVDDLIDELQNRCDRLRREARGRPVVARLRIEGRSPLHAELRSMDLDRDLISTLHDRTEGWTDSVLIDQIELATRPDIDIDARRQLDDFTGDFLKQAQGLRDTEAGTADAVRELLRSRPESSKIDAEIAAFSDAELREILDEAELLGLDRLLGKDD